MSYILDALKKADAQRERDSNPGLHAPTPRVVFAHTKPQFAAMPLFWMALAATLLLLGALAWRMSARPVAQDVAEPPAAAPEPARLVAPVESRPEPKPEPEPVIAPPSPPPLAGPAPAKPKLVPAAKAAVAHKAQRLPPMPAEAALPGNPAAAEGRTYAREELPPEIQRELPALAVSGSTYSENPAYRMLIINGQLVHEGDKAAPELSLEQIRQRSALLKYKGYRYWITY